jgi:GT2 family glycosyltransferase
MLSIVIPVYNRKQFTRDCLRSLISQTLPADWIIVVDDGSTDGTPQMLKKEFPHVVVLSTKGNLFWTASTNEGIRFALEKGSDYVMTLNNDTFAPSDFLEKMMEKAIEKPEALIGALDVDAKTKKPYYGGEIVNWLWSSSRMLLKDLSAKDRKGLHEVSLFPARGLLIPRKVFETIGLFEEKKLPHYMADYDFTLMAVRHGFKIFCNYDTCIYTYPDEGGDHKIRKSKTVKNYFDHLFGIKGGGNLKNFTIYTLRNCPPGFIPFSLIFGYMRRLSGYWLK